MVSATNANSGQVTYTGGINYISVRSAPTTGSSTDGLCDYQDRTCHTINAGTKHALQGMAIDGNSNLWVSESANGGVLQIAESSATANPVPATEFLHGATGATGGGTVTATAPYGIGIDATGNVWMTNAGCNTTGCTPGNFTLTEIVGAGSPDDYTGFGADYRRWRPGGHETDPLGLYQLLTEARRRLRR